MRRLMFALLMLFAAIPARAQVPPEWEAAAQAVIGEIETNAKPWGQETRQGWALARAWRQHNNGNTEIILAEYLTFTALCRESGCGGNTIAGKSIAERAAEVRRLIGENGGSYGVATAVNAWLAGLDEPARKNAVLWGKDLDASSADFATGNLYALDWLLARARPAGEQAQAFARLALFIQGRAWIGPRCLDITKVATVLDAPPKVKACN
jgi:predicted NodU family carbamoyl transferase